MDFSFTEEQQAIQALARSLIEKRATHERLRELESGSEWMDRELWEELATAGLLGVALPTEVGGTGLGLFELCLLLEEMGRGVAPLPLLTTLVEAALPIARFGSEAQRQELLPPVVAGDQILAAALLELGTSDPARPRVQARSEGAGWSLEGEKLCVPAAHLAARLLVPARTRENALGIFLVDPGAPGVTLERQETSTLEPRFTLTLSGVALGAGDVLGDPHEGAAIVRWIETRSLVGLCAIQVGVAEEALRRTAEYTAQRKQFGRPIATFQSVALRAADAYIDVEAMRSMLWQAAWRVEAGRPAAREVAAAKWWACRAGQRVVHTAQHLHGGMGADLDYPIHRYFLWAKQVELGLGGAGHQLARLGRMLARDEA